MTPPLPSSRVGVIGLGAMGGPIAANFAAAGQSLLVRDTSATAEASLVERFPTLVARADAAPDGFAGCDVVVLILPNSDIVELVVAARGGLFDTLQAGSTIVDMGSSVPARTVALAAEAQAKGLALVDAPVSGGVARALRADLAIMAGGSTADLARVEPLLLATGPRVLHVGPVSTGHAAKALNNLLSATGLVAAAEVLLVARDYGIEPAAMLEVLNSSSGRNHATETKFNQFVLSGTYAAGFSAQLMNKDLGIAADLAAKSPVPLTVTQMTVAFWEQAAAALGERADHTEVVRHLEELSGLTLAD